MWRMTYLDYSWVLLTTLSEFVISEFCILVSVHISKYLVHALEGQVRWGGEGKGKGRDLFGGVFICGELDHLTGHLVDGSDDLEHLVVGDEAVLVYVIELECPYGGVRWGDDGHGGDIHLSFSSRRPRLVTLRAQINSLKSIVPFLFSSKTLKT